MRTLSHLKPARMSGNKRHEESVIIRTPSAMRTQRQLLLIGGIMGIVPTGLFHFIALMKKGVFEYGPQNAWGALATIGYLVPFIAFAVFQWSRLRRISDVWVWAGTTGAMAVIYFGIALEVGGMFLGAKEMLVVLGVTIVSAIVHAVLATAVWYATVALNRARCLRVVVQEAACCATCGYDLSGKQSMVCPSCGTAFTLKDLRTPDGLSKLATTRRGET